MRILFYLAVWKRPEITEICFMGLNRLMKYTGGESLAVISETSMIPLCEKYGIKWVMEDNLPIGRKKNLGLKFALNFDWDYVIELGSDDLIKNELIDLYDPYLGERDFLGVGSVAFLNSENGRCRWLKQGSLFGLGRCLSRSVIEKFPGLYPEYNSGLDKKILFKLQTAGVFQKCVNSDKPLTIDIKSDVNIWKYDPNQGVKISFDEVVDGLSEGEIVAIKNLQCVTV